MPALAEAGLADAVDGFCENIAFCLSYHIPSYFIVGGIGMITPDIYIDA